MSVSRYRWVSLAFFCLLDVAMKCCCFCQQCESRVSSQDSFAVYNTQFINYTYACSRFTGCYPPRESGKRAIVKGKRCTRGREIPIGAITCGKCTPSTIMTCDTFSICYNARSLSVFTYPMSYQITGFLIVIVIYIVLGLGVLHQRAPLTNTFEFNSLTSFILVKNFQLNGDG